VRFLDCVVQLPVAFVGCDAQSRTMGVAYHRGAVRAAVGEGRQEPDGGDPVPVGGSFAGQGAGSEM
jgi:hypothetical protein